MERIQTDVVIAGGGVAGLMATIALAAEGLTVLCVDPVPPVTEAAADGSDLRSTAFLMPSITLMERVGLWSALAPFAAPLRVMRLADAGGEENGIREVADFTAREIGQEVFGYNLPNWLLRREMTGFIAKQPLAELRTGVGVSDLLVRSDHARVTLTDGTSVAAELVIGADGRNSFVREALGIGARTTRYGQKALVFAVNHDLPHEDISTEIHRTGGPFTLVPLRPQGTQNRSAVVWMETGARAAELYAMPDEAFAEALNARACGVLGRLTPASPRRIWPIISQTASRLSGPRTALIAEAAHVMPPIGAQGLNMSLADIETLLDLVTTARSAGKDIGTSDLLARYARARRPDVALRITGVDLLNRVAMTEAQPLRDLRRIGLRALSGIGPLKQAAMHLGLGAR
ncbi:MAG: UbiH/UbiF family hydroxylase [Pseudomonadota bacterium]